MIILGMAAPCSRKQQNSFFNDKILSKPAELNSAGFSFSI